MKALRFAGYLALALWILACMALPGAFLVMTAVIAELAGGFDGVRD